MSGTTRNRFSGLPNTGPFEGQRNCVFISPALIEPRSGNDIEIESLSVTIRSNEVYTSPSVDDTRLFRFGPNSTSRTNNPVYRTQFKQPSVVATMIQVIPPGPTTIFKIR